MVKMQRLKSIHDRSELNLMFDYMLDPNVVEVVKLKIG